MIEPPPPRPLEPERKLDLVELRIANLRREIEADPEPVNRAAILYQVGALYEHELNQVDAALDHYRKAHAIVPDFQPAIVAELRIAERSKNGGTLASLRSEHAAKTRDPAVRAAALMDLAVHSADWAAMLRSAIALSPEPVVPALLLEWLAASRGGDEDLRHALRTQAERARPPSLQAASWLELALSEMDAGHQDAAIDALDRACETGALEWQARSLQLRIAREHGRWDVFVRAAAAMARFLESVAEADEPPDPLDLSVPEPERLPMAAFLWEQAATGSATQLDDLDAAARYIESALQIVPDSRAVRLQQLLIQERRGDQAATREASEWFRVKAPQDPAFVAHELRQALSSDDLREATTVLRDATEQYPGSEYARAALDVALIRGNAHAERATHLIERAHDVDAEASARRWWHAAQLTAASSAAPDQAQRLYSEAVGATVDHKEWILREALGAALRANRPDLIIERCEELMDCELPVEERAWLAFVRYEALQNVEGGDEAAQRLLADCIEDSDTHGWAPSIARARAAWSGDAESLARAHDALANLCTGDSRLGHLCAAATAYMMNRSWAAAERVLRQALSTAPDDRYVVSLLDRVLCEGGRPEDVVALAREQAQRRSSAPVSERSLLLAGATAEGAGDFPAARHAYEQALTDAPRSPSAGLALLDVARREVDRHALVRAYEELSNCTLGGGVPELYAILHGDALARDPETQAASARAYERALEHPATSLAGAVALLSTPARFTNADQCGAANEIVADAGAASDEGTPGFAAAYGALQASLGQETSSAGDAWLDLAALAPTEGLRAEALLEGLRANRIARGADAADELFMLAQQVDALAERDAGAAIAIDEALAPGDDPEFRAAALERMLRHSEALGRGGLDAAHRRALVEADRGEDAVALLSDAVNERPDDLGLWETLRGAARQAGQWPLVAQSCERLAQFVRGSLKADLLEEAGVVRADCLGQYQQAEDLFRSALEEDPTREVAFRRLHDLLSELEDAEALQALVSNRLALGGPKDRLDLLYEHARLLRGFSDRPGALEALQELFATAPDHAGALALAAEVHVSLEQWPEAVECLRRLSRANIPDEQRRVAHLGAADFLEAHLMAPHESLEELRAIEALGLADSQIWIRIGALEAGFGKRGASADAYARALEEDPTNAIAISSLIDLIDADARRSALLTYERAIWGLIDGGELDETLLEGLARAARWRGQTERAEAARAVQRALGLVSSSGEGGASDFSGVSIASVWNPESDPILRQVLRRAGPALSKDRLRTKKAAPSDPLCAELEHLSERFGATVGSIELTDELVTIVARSDGDGEIDWIAPHSARGGLNAAERFVAGRLAWAAPHGAARLLESSPHSVAGTLAAILRVSRCEVTTGEPVLPAAEIKMRRAVRKAVHEAVGGATFDSASLLAFARSIQRSADRAGLLASGDIGAALSTLLSGSVEVQALRASPRGLDLLRFWLGDGSPLWGSHV